MRSLLAGVDVRLALDTAIAAYLLDPAESRYLLDEVLRRYAKVELPSDRRRGRGPARPRRFGISVALRTARHALAVERLIEPLTRALDDQSLRQLYDDTEVPSSGCWPAWSTQAWASTPASCGGCALAHRRGRAGCAGPSGTTPASASST